MKNEKIHQLIIVGAGPAGLTAGLFAQRYGLDYLIIGQRVGGTALEAHIVDNYPGFNNVSGSKLMEEFEKQVDAKLIRREDVKNIHKNKDETFQVITYQNKYSSQSLILAMGMKIRKLDIKNESDFVGRGVSYCSACDGPLAKDKIVSVVGGGDSALTSAVKLADLAKKVYLIHRRDEFRGAPVWIDKVKQHPKIEIVYSANVTQVTGDKLLKQIILDTGQIIDTDWLFIEIGGRPALDLCSELKLVTEENYLVVDKNQATNIKGVFAAGDIVNNPFKQIVTACGQAAIATNTVYGYLRTLKQ